MFRTCSRFATLGSFPFSVFESGLLGLSLHSQHWELFPEESLDVLAGVSPLHDIPEGPKSYFRVKKRSRYRARGVPRLGGSDEWGEFSEGSAGD